MNPIKSQIEEFEKEIMEMRKVPTTKEYQYADYKMELNRKSILIWETEAKLQTLKSLEPLFEKMEKEIQSLRTQLNTMEKER